MAEKLATRNPRTGENDYSFPVPSIGELKALAADLRAGQRAWSALSLEDRIERLGKLADALQARHREIADALTVDTGRRRLSQIETAGVPGWIHAWSAAAAGHLRAEPTQNAADGSVRFDQQGVPYPLVSVISPWNYPFLLSMIDAVPALLAGCAVVVKPSEVTPRFVEPVRAAIASVPEVASVLAYVQGDGRVGAQIIDLADAVCFTGSVATGQKVAAQAAPGFKKVFLELGGKDPAVILRSADLDAAARAVVRGAVENTGQTCYSIERVYVDAEAHDALVDRIVALCDELELSYPNPEAGHIGPFIFARQADVVAEQIEDARSRGAEVLRGGEIETLGGGKWLRPTVLTNVTHDMAVMRDETFGPVIPIMAFDDLDQAVTLANDTRYGLSGVVFGETEEAAGVARRIDAGGMSVNGYGLVMRVALQAEKHAFNQSGAGGSRFGPDGIRRFLRRKMIAVNCGDVEALDAIDEAGAV